MAAHRAAGPPERVPSAVRAKRTPKDFMLKAHLHGVKGRRPLALHERHRACSPGSYEADVASSSSTPMLLTEVLAEVFAVVIMKESGDFDLDMWDKCEGTPTLA